MKRNSRNEKNIRVQAENRDNRSGFVIYLEFSGQREYLMSHRHNGLLYDLLKDSPSLDEVRRWKPDARLKNTSHRIRRGSSSQLQSMVDHLLLVIDDYVMEREAC